MRRLLLVLLLALPGFGLLGGCEPASELEAQAVALGIRDVPAFVETVRSVCSSGRLPERYLTKAEARALGWRPGGDLCRLAPGRMLGGDRFYNRERLLPDRPGRIWWTADIDARCGERGPRRLVFSNDGLVYVTLDHYRSFIRLPCPGR